MNNITLTQSDENILIYNKFKYILSGCRTMNDALYFGGKIINKYPNKKNLINSMIYSKLYQDCIDMRTIVSSLEIINKYNKNDTDNYVKTLLKNSVSDIQHKAITRTSNQKNNNKTKQINNRKTTHITLFNKSSIFEDIQKQCPHCKQKCNIDDDTDYVICGYYDSHIGYNWAGCGKDWCAKCNKKLCKQWGDDKLFVIYNRIHNNTCCVEYSTKYNIPIDEMCTCDKHLFNFFK